MKQLTSAEFRKFYARESEPIEVTAYGKAIGFWYPAGTEPSIDGNPISERPEAEPDPQRMTIRPVKANNRPPLVPTEKRILDPIQRTQVSREMWSQLNAKMNAKSDGRRR